MERHTDGSDIRGQACPRYLVPAGRKSVIVLRRTVTLYSQLGSGSGRVGTGDDAGDGARLFS